MVQGEIIWLFTTTEGRAEEEAMAVTNQDLALIDR